MRPRSAATRGRRRLRPRASSSRMRLRWGACLGSAEHLATTWDRMLHPVSDKKLPVQLDRARRQGGQGEPGGGAPRVRGADRRWRTPARTAVGTCRRGRARTSATLQACGSFMEESGLKAWEVVRRWAHRVRGQLDAGLPNLPALRPPAAGQGPVAPDRQHPAALAMAPAPPTARRAGPGGVAAPALGALRAAGGTFRGRH